MNKFTLCLMMLYAMFVAVPDAWATDVNVSAVDRVSTLGNKYYKIYYVVTDGTEYPVCINGNSVICSNNTAATPAVFYFSAPDANNLYHISLAGTNKYWPFNLNQGLSTTDIANVQIFNSIYNTGLYWLCLLNSDGNTASRTVLANANNNTTLSYNSRAWSGTSGTVFVNHAAANGWNSEVKLVEVEDICDVTYIYTYKGNAVKSSPFKIAEGDSRPSVSIPLGCMADMSNVPEKITESGIYEIPITTTAEFPFEFSADYTTAKWYTWRMANRTNGNASFKGYVWNNGTKLQQTDLDEQPTKAKYLYAFVGNPFSFKIMTTDERYVYTTAANTADVVISTEGTDLSIMASTFDPSIWPDYDKAFYFNAIGFGGGFNEMGSNDVDPQGITYRKVGYWTGGGVYDTGSLIAIEPVEDILVYKIVFAEGAPSNGALIYNEETYVVNGPCNALASYDAISINDLEVAEVAGFSSELTISNRVITVTYTPLIKSDAWVALHAKIIEAKAMTLPEGPWGTDPGYYNQEAVEALPGAITTAEGVLEAAGGDQTYIAATATLRAAMNAAKMIMPEVGKIYQLISAFPNFETTHGTKMAIYNNGGTNLRWMSVNNNDSTFCWAVTAVDGNSVTFQSIKDGKYPSTVNTTVQPIPLTTDVTACTLASLGLGQFNITSGTSKAPFHTGNHSNGYSNNGDVMNWAGSLNSCSAWYIHDTEIPFPVTSPSEIEEGKIYTISTNNRGAVVWDGTSAKLEGTMPLSITLDSTNPNHQFTFIKKEGTTDKFYMVSIGADKFVYQSGTKAALAEVPHVIWTIKTSGKSNYPLMIDAASGNHWNVDNNGYVFINTLSTIDAGNCFAFKEVGDVEAAYVTELKERIKSCTKITYTSTNGHVVTPTVSAFGSANIISNTYSDGKGTIECDDVITTFSANCFKDCSTLKAITIPNSVTSIGDKAFRYCNLSFVVIPQSVESIGVNPFSGNENLAIIVVDAENTTFDCRDNCNAIIRKSDNALISGCKNTVIPNSVTSIGSLAFYGCSSLTSITIPNSVTSIGSDAFLGCSSLTSITIPNSVTSIGTQAFNGCSSLTAVHINSLESWCKIKFDGNYSNPTSFAHKLYLNNVELKDIVIPASIDTINACTFSGCSSLTSIDIPNSVTSIGSRAFYGCSSLASINIPNSVTSIGERAFLGCSNLTSITIPNSVKSIGDYAFKDCSSLSSINLSDSVTSIGGATFSGCSSLTSITIPNSVTSIKGSAFYGCSSLSSITIPNSVTSIGDYAFYGCSSLSSITIPNSVTSIGERAFYSCSKLTSITIPNSVTSIGDYAFRYCSSLTSITNLSTTPQTITSDCFSNYYATLHVYEGLKSVYQNAANWSKFTIVDDVPPTKATSITMDASTYYCKVYGTISPSATVNPEATIKALTWESSDPSVLVITDANTGQALGLKVGVATITAKTTDGSDLSASATVYVGTYYPVTSITLSQTSGTLEINKTLTLTATVLPENATAKSVKWTSSNTDIAIVSAEGVVTALAPGTAIITATSVDGTNIKATCEITVPEFNVKYTDAAGQEICRYLASGDDAAINDAYKRLEVLQPIEDVNVTYTRNFDSKMVNNWQAWFMPFDVDYDDMSDGYEVAQIYGVLMDKAGVPYIAFQKMTEGLVKANVPYAVRVKEAGDAVVTTTTTLQQTANTNTFSVQSTANNFTFGGVYENSYLSAEYPTYALNKSGNFALMASDVYLRPFRFYMRITDREDNPYATVTTPQEVKVVVLGEDETSIENIDVDADVDGEIYNLAGQKLQKLQKGINIVNGKKILF